MKVYVVVGDRLNTSASVQGVYSSLEKATLEGMVDIIPNLPTESDSWIEEFEIDEKKEKINDKKRVS